MDGGVQLPDIQKYHAAILISVILPFNQIADMDFWNRLCKEDTYPYDLNETIWHKPKERLK